ncbi:MAG TPA: cysteine desulfurase family protein [Atopostipes sp.]|nr:cysteine desulfurase family protein [Atopostipes sp.]
MIYFDNSATTKVSDTVLQTYKQVSENYFGNPSSLHKLGNVTSQLLQQSRTQIANTLGVQSGEIYFTSGGTEGDNWVIKGTAIEKARFGKHMITTSVEHPAVYESMQQLEALGWEITYLPVNDEGVISVEDLKKAIRKDTVLVSVIAVNNEVGSMQPLDEISEVLKDYPSIHFHVDAVQALGLIDLPLGKDSRIDFAVFSGHKFKAPRGIGFVYAKEGRQLAPLLTGGGQEKSMRSGTENLPAIAAMAKAVRLTFEKAEEKQDHLRKLQTKLRNYFDEKDKVTIFSPKGHAPHILCFGIEGIRGEVTVHALEEKEIYISTTSACSSRALDVESSTLHAMGVPKNIAETANRVSFSASNTEEEVDKFMQVFDELLEKFEVINA